MTIHLKGVGWTEYDNIYVATYDNAYMGYVCGFNSQGDVVMNFTATGEPGEHLIDLYPGIYEGPADRNAAIVSTAATDLCRRPSRKQDSGAPLHVSSHAFARTTPSNLHAQVTQSVVATQHRRQKGPFLHGYMGANS